jgi:hypothetical protein
MQIMRKLSDKMTNKFILFLFFMAISSMIHNTYSGDLNWKINNKPTKTNEISFFDIYSNAKKYDGKLILIHGVISSTTSEFSSENYGPSDYGNGFLFFDKPHFDIHDFSTSISVYFKCQSKIDMHVFDGKSVAVIGAYWHVEQGIGNKNMGVIQLGGIIGINTDGTNNPTVLCSNELNGVPGTRPKE